MTVPAEYASHLGTRIKPSISQAILKQLNSRYYISPGPINLLIRERAPSRRVLEEEVREKRGLDRVSNPHKCVVVVFRTKNPPRVSSFSGM